MVVRTPADELCSSNKREMQLVILSKRAKDRRGRHVAPQRQGSLAVAYREDQAQWIKPLGKGHGGSTQPIRCESARGDTLKFRLTL